MALPTEKLYTVDEFEEFIARPENRDRHFELIDGVIVEKAMPTEEHALTIGVFSGELYIYARGRGIGLPGPESRFRVPGNFKNTRQPDLSMTIDPDVPITVKGAAPRAPDIIVEVRSPDENYDQLRDKARWYVANGVLLVFLVFPRPKIVEVYRPDVPSEILTVEDTIDGFDVLPGFALLVSNLFITKRSG
jgi:Uma2 family endonuclease